MNEYRSVQFSCTVFLLLILNCMRSIERRFVQDKRENPNLSSLLCFGRAVAGQKFSRKMISKYFSILVDKNDYAQNDRNSLIFHFFLLSRDLEESQIRSIFAPRGFVFVKLDDFTWEER